MSMPRAKRIRNLLKSAVGTYKITQSLKVKVKDVHNLPIGLRVVVNYDDRYQPIREASGLLAGVCGHVASNRVLFPISFESWSAMADTYKDNAWERTLKIKQPKFTI
ncbi:hypothetical protein DEO72_LG2g3492 [Vigna unguiculata]|uniref:Uncharacterized protein n=1 Tax=Vigna unguiculata TaxID=3917 RepID=A0A4D6L3S3_VIGUN|nr:hypothetical protein DEO72_LG2g3492 [Vigna unguiculata]